jgi:hypothetical protein
MHAHVLQGDCQQAGCDLFAGSDDRVIFARIMHRRGFARPANQFIGLAGHGRDHDRDFMAGIDLALDMARHVADAGDVGDGGSAEFHHDARHGSEMPLTEPAWGRMRRNASG